MRAKLSPLAPALMLALFVYTGHATTLLYTFGGDFVSPGATGVPDSLNSMDPASAASVTNVQTPVGNGNTGFNGGLVSANGLLYGIGNDSNGFATLYSMHTDGTGLTAVVPDFNTSGPSTGVIFQNGLAQQAGSFFYAIGQNATGEGLYLINPGGGTSEQFALPTFGGTYTGLAWDSGLAAYVAIIAGATPPGLSAGDYLVHFGSTGSGFGVLADLNNFFPAPPVGTHLGGLADAGGGTFFDIWTNPATFTGELDQITVGPSFGFTTVVNLYDTGIPLAQNAGVAAINSSPTTPTPEPVSALGIGTGLIFVGCLLKRRKK